MYQSPISLINLAGLLPTITLEGTSLVTILPVAILISHDFKDMGTIKNGKMIFRSAPHINCIALIQH